LEVGKPSKSVLAALFFIFMLILPNASSITVNWKSACGDQTLYDHDANRAIFLKIFFDEISHNRTLTVLENEIITQQVFHIISSNIANVTVVINVDESLKGEFDIPIRIEYEINGEMYIHEQTITVTYNQSFNVELIDAPNYISDEPQEIVFKMDVWESLTNVTLELFTGIGIRSEPNISKFGKINPGSYIIRYNISESNFFQIPISNGFAFSLSLEVNAEIDKHRLYYRTSPIYLDKKIESSGSDGNFVVPLLLLALAFIMITIYIYRRHLK
jgi:hypothetical protein